MAIGLCGSRLNEKSVNNKAVQTARELDMARAFMKRGLVIALFLLGAHSVQSQHYFNLLIKNHSNTYNVCINDVDEIATIGLVSINGGDRYAIDKIDEFGNELVKKNWFYPFHAMYGGFSGSLNFVNNRYYHTGWTVDTGYNYRGLFTIWDSDFNLLFDREYGFTDSNSIFYSSIALKDKVTIVGDNNVYISNIQQYKRQLLLMLLDTLGNKLWERSYPAKAGLWHLQGNTVITTHDGGYAVGGGGAYSNSQTGSFAYVLLVDSLGNKINERYYMNDDYGNFVIQVQQKVNGNFLIVYSEAYQLFGGSIIPSSRRIILEELDKNDLSTIWHKEYLGAYQNTIITNRLIPQNDSTYLITGYYYPDYILYRGNYAAQLGFIFAITENGDSLWYRDYSNQTDSSELNYLNDIAVTPDGGIVGAGRLQTPKSPYTGGLASHVWLFKTDSIGCLYPGCDTVYQKPKAPVTEFKVYPIPAMAGQDLIIELPDATRATAVLYNAIGQMIFKSELKFSSGTASLSATGGSVGGGVTSGIFILHIQTSTGSTHTQKVVFQ